MAAPWIVPQGVSTWDESLYGFFLLDGYAQEQLSHLRRSETVYAEPWFRRVASSKPLRLDVGAEQTAAQFIAFETWWQDTLSWGSQWFYLPLSVTGSEVTYTVHLPTWTVAPKDGSKLSLVRLDMQMEALLLEPV